jgi:hypothetical protein
LPTFGAAFLAAAFAFGPALAANFDFAGDLRTADERSHISIREFKIMQDA